MLYSQEKNRVAWNSMKKRLQQRWFPVAKFLGDIYLRTAASGLTLRSVCLNLCFSTVAFKTILTQQYYENICRFQTRSLNTITREMPSLYLTPTLFETVYNHPWLAWDFTYLSFASVGTVYLIVFIIWFVYVRCEDDQFKVWTERCNRKILNNEICSVSVSEPFCSLCN